MPDYRLSADESALAVIPANGTTIGNGKARQNLDWEEERYWVARDALVDRGLIAEVLVGVEPSSVWRNGTRQ